LVADDLSGRVELRVGLELDLGEGQSDGSNVDLTRDVQRRHRATSALLRHVHAKISRLNRARGVWVRESIDHDVQRHSRVTWIGVDFREVELQSVVFVGCFLASDLEVGHIRLSKYKSVNSFYLLARPFMAQIQIRLTEHETGTSSLKD